MQPHFDKQKLLELSEKAFYIEEEILKEEKKYQQALTNDDALSSLMLMREKIKNLHRKETLYCEAIEMRMKESQAI